MSEYIGSIDKKQIHIIKINFDYDVYENNFEAKRQYIINRINHAWMIRSGCCENKNDIPKCSNVIFNETILPYNHKKGFRWEHYKLIDKYSLAVEEIERQTIENYDFEKDEVYQM